MGGVPSAPTDRLCPVPTTPTQSHANVNVGASMPPSLGVPLLLVDEHAASDRHSAHTNVPSCFLSVTAAHVTRTARRAESPCDQDQGCPRLVMVRVRKLYSMRLFDPATYIRYWPCSMPTPTSVGRT